MLDDLRRLLALFLIDMTLKVLPKDFKVAFASAIVPFLRWHNSKMEIET